MITPSRFPNDPWGYTLNQSGHFLIGALAWWALGSVVGVFIAYVLIIEAPQIYQNRSKSVIIDSIEDALHVACGAIVGVGFFWALPFWVIIATMGAEWRR